jgi:cobyrinic acid a,c-diamide synthase
MGEEGVKFGAAHDAANKDIAVFEGVMGFYDGLGGGSCASSNHISLLTNTPAVLVVNAKGAALSVCAIIKGFLEFEKNNIRGIILNNVSGAMFRFYKQMIEERLDINVIGFLPHIPEIRIESRRLGLVGADEIADIKEKIDILKENALKYIDMEALFNISKQAGQYDINKDFLPVKINYERPNIYVADDEAFLFRYEDNHDLLKAFGADIKFFSPIRDRELPGDADGLILWSGYPEIYGTALNENTGMKRSIKSAVDSGLPVYAECGGFLYLQQGIFDAQGETYEMLGVLPGYARMTDKLQNFGYYEIEAQRDNLLCAAGGKINAHFYHHSVSDCGGDCFMAVKQNGKTFPCVVSKNNVIAGHQHLHFWGNPDFAGNFVNACAAYKIVRRRV